MTLRPRTESLELWLLHESVNEKQQVPKLTSSTVHEMDAGRGSLPGAYRTARGFHIAPQTPQGSLENVKLLSALPSKPILTLDLLADAYVDAARYRELSFLDRITAFLPSKEEVESIWQPKSLSDWIRTQSTTYSRCVAVKMGVNGSLVCDGSEGSVYHVPAFTTKVADMTGSGDSYCGGFLAGLVLGRPASAWPLFKAPLTMNAGEVVDSDIKLRSFKQVVSNPSFLSARSKWWASVPKAPRPHQRL
jgi:hypothetical protein